MSTDNTSLNILMSLIFRKAYELWTQHKGRVPITEIEAFDARMDLPKGSGYLAIKRLKEDKKFREIIRKAWENGDI